MATPAGSYQNINISGGKVQLGHSYSQGRTWFDREEEEERRRAEEARIREVLEWLWYPRMDLRQDSIRQPHQKTFQWILSDGNAPDGTSNPGLFEWIKNGNGIFWVSGKAASGKSTLMKMIAAHTRTSQALAMWSQGQSLICPSFYFWLKGTDMQRSQLGLFQSLLYEILDARKDLIRAVFPRWNAKHMLEEPTVPSLAAALELLLRHRDLQSYICFFIDGLDEYEGSGMDIAAMADILRGLADIPRVKLLVSSRPLEVLKDNISSWPHLKLQDLTRSDIYAFVDSELCQHPRYADLRAENFAGADALVLSLLDRALGVFLWVRLVVASLLDGLRHEDMIEDLMRRLDELPTELNDMFLVTIGRIPKRYRQEAFQLLYLMHIWTEDTYERPKVDSSVLTVHFALGYRSMKPPAYYQQHPPDRAQVKRWIERTRGVVNSRCLGLLEVGNRDSDPEVQFLHRTLADFLSEREVSKKVAESCIPSFDSNVATINAVASVVMIRCFTERSISPSDLTLACLAHWCRLAEQSTGLAHTSVMNAVEDILPQVTRPPRSEDANSVGEPPRSCLVTHAMQAKCEFYIDHVLTQGQAGLPNMPERPWLYHALGSFRISETLLHQGADPNRMLRGIASERVTVWEGVLLALEKPLDGGMKHAYISDPFLALRMLRMYLQHGADPTIRCEAGRWRVPSEFIGDVLQRLCPGQHTPATIRDCYCERSREVKAAAEELALYVGECEAKQSRDRAAAALRHKPESVEVMVEEGSSCKCCSLM